MYGGAGAAAAAGATPQRPGAVPTHAQMTVNAATRAVAAIAAATARIAEHEQ
jgi:hypothetical protein